MAGLLDVRARGKEYRWLGVGVGGAEKKRKGKNSAQDGSITNWHLGSVPDEYQLAVPARGLDLGPKGEEHSNSEY